MNNALTQYSEESYIFFSIGTYNYAFSAKYVLDIMQLVELEYPESMPDFIAGLLEYNNKMIKIIDIRSILKLEATNYSLNSKIVITKTNNDIFGILIDDVKEIRRINTLSLNNPPYDTKQSFLEAIFTEKDFSATVINLEHIEETINSSDFTPADINKSSSLLLPKDISSKEKLHRRRLHYARKMRGVAYEIIKSQDTYITFYLKKHICCVKILHVAGFYKFANVKLTKVPCTPDFIMGIVSIKGRYITVIDLLKYTENKTSEITKDTSIVVIEYEDYQLGIITDAIGETIDMDENLLKKKEDYKPSCLNEYVMGEKLYLILDIKRLFGDEKLYVS